MIEIRPIDSFTDDAFAVAQNLRHEDVDELWALGRSLPQGAIQQSIEVSAEKYVAYAGDTPIAVLGATTNVLARHASPWLLGTREIDNHAADYMRLGRAFAAHLLLTHTTLSNIASTSNRRTLVFLSRMGFAIGKPFLTGTGASAVQFTMERPHV